MISGCLGRIWNQSLLNNNVLVETSLIERTPLGNPDLYVEHCETVVEPYITIVCLELPEASPVRRSIFVSIPRLVTLTSPRKQNQFVDQFGTMTSEDVGSRISY